MRLWSRIESFKETWRLAVRYPWPAAAVVGLVYFFTLAVAIPHGWTKIRVSPVERTPAGFWSIVGTSVLLFIVAGMILQLFRPRPEQPPPSSRR